MSAPLPREPRPGERLDADWGRAVARALRSQRLSGGPGVRVSSGPDGTTVSIPAGAPGSGEGAAARPMPLDLSLAASGEEARALVRVAGFSARRGADAVPVDSARCAGLASAVSGGAEFWDAGAVSSAKGFCLYVADVAAAGQSPDVRWGVATGATVAAAVSAIPSSGVLLALPVGAVSVGGDVLQLFHGCVALAPPEGGGDGGGVPSQADQNTTLPSSDAGEEGGTTANSATWEADGATGLVEWYVSRVAYDHTASTPVLYAFLRKRIVAADGRLVSVSAETRVPVDQPVAVTLPS